MNKALLKLRVVAAESGSGLQQKYKAPRLRRKALVTSVLRPRHPAVFSGRSEQEALRNFEDRKAGHFRSHPNPAPRHRRIEESPAWLRGAPQVLPPCTP